MSEVKLKRKSSYGQWFFVSAAFTVFVAYVTPNVSEQSSAGGVVLTILESVLAITSLVFLVLWVTSKARKKNPHHDKTSTDE